MSKTEKQVMGSARTQSQVAEAPKSAGQVKETRTVTRRLRSDAVSRGSLFWWKDRTGELSVVTDDAQNEALGIEKIRIFEPSESMYAAGILCKVNVDTVIGQVQNLAIFQSKYHEDDITLSVNAREWEDDQGNKRYQRDLELNPAFKAQILSYVSQFLVPVEED